MVLPPNPGELPVPLDQEIPKQQCNPTCTGEIRPEGQRLTPRPFSKQYQPETDSCPCYRSQQNHEWQGLPAEPGAKGSQ